jgi:hypothetical protein
MESGCGSEGAMDPEIKQRIMDKFWFNIWNISLS